ncbi:YraN family protein [Aestuariispira ectoiniformans]|uniref:YraN family protein n=1 Tax=Aestuariispira ectoiniformans TaxID=2775080 RepID=UPI00223A816C|nr:YraN family protein [Aestuariispira ectoiniformans]
MTGHSRHHRYRIGHRAEWLAACWLRLKGYRILARRLKTPVGEIDLLARRGGLCLVVEVKHRRDHATAAEAITARQWQRIARAYDWWRMQNGAGQGADEAVRFDAILVAPWRFPNHVQDAWRPGL